MATPWAQVPSTFRLPFIWGSTVAAPAIPADDAQRGMLIGQGTSGTGTTFQVTSADQVASIVGRGSVLHRMAMKALAAHPTGIWYALGVADHGSGVAREMTVTYTATSSAVAGTHRIRVGSDFVDVALPAYATGTAETAHAGALACDAAFDAFPDLPFAKKEAATLGVATIKFNCTGTVGNGCRVATDEDLPLPTGWTAAIEQTVAGSQDPTFTSTQIDAIGASAQWDKIALWLDGFSAVLGAELDARADWSRGLRGFGFTSYADAYDDHVTDLTTTPRQYRWMSRLLTEEECRAPAYEIAAEACAECMKSDEVKPGLKMGSVVLKGCQATRPGSEFSCAERNVLTRYGGTTFHDAGGYLCFDRIVTTRYVNTYGTRDETAYDAPKMWLTIYALANWTATMASLYDRVRLLADRDGRLPAGCVSPAVVEGDTVCWYKRLYDRGLVNDLEGFQTNCTAVIPDDDPNRVDILLPMNFARNLEILAPVMTY